MRIPACSVVLQFLAAFESNNPFDNELCLARGGICGALQHGLLFRRWEKVL